MLDQLWGHRWILAAAAQVGPLGGPQVPQCEEGGLWGSHTLSWHEPLATWQSEPNADEEALTSVCFISFSHYNSLCALYDQLEPKCKCMDE